MGGLAWGGLLADLVAVPHADAMLVKLPDWTSTRSPSPAPATTSPTPGAPSDPQLAAEPGAEVLVVGVTPVGLARSGCTRSGSPSMLGVGGRYLPRRRSPTGSSIAAGFGATVSRRTARLARSGSFPSPSTPAGRPTAALRAQQHRVRRHVHQPVGLSGEDPPLPMFAMYSRCCTLHTGRAHVRPAIPVVLDLVARGFDPTVVTSLVVSRDVAVEALARPPMKLVIDCR
jgi:threonine dehydrogenase-like Zn-dependent dehydrogenase